MSETGLTLSDFHRLAMEIAVSVGDTETWAKKVGIDHDTLEEIGSVGSRTVFNKLVDIGEEQFNADNEADPEEPFEVQANMNELIGRACLNAFILGWEAREQFGGKS